MRTRLPTLFGVRRSAVRSEPRRLSVRLAAIALLPLATLLIALVEGPPLEVADASPIYLIAVATKEYEGWRGVYEEKDERGEPTGVVVDRFDTAWDPSDPLADLRVRYGLDPSPRAPGRVARGRRLPVLPVGAP